jgi:IclR family transcriptional regulator, pca regulon regulatory protein
VTRARRSPTGDPNYMLSLARGLSVIRAFGDGQGSRSVADLARQTGLSLAAVRRCLYTLTALGYAKGADGVYDLTPTILALGYAYVSSTALVRVGQPVLERVADELHESSSMAQLEGHEIVYVARAATHRILSIGLSVGSRLPAVSTSMGRVLLAHLDDASLAQRLAQITLVAHTPKTITNRTVFRAALARVRTQGFALVDQEFEVGLRSIAVPVLGRDRQVVAAINVGVHASRATPTTLRREFLPVLRQAAADISQDLKRR